MTSSQGRLVYLDTSALMRRAEAAVPSPTQRNAFIAPLVDAIVQDPSADVRLSTLTMSEFRDALARDVRAQQPHEVHYTAEWMSAAVLEAMGLIAGGRISEVPIPADAEQRAGVLVDIATREHGVAFHIWDATHLVIACSWGHSLGQKVELITTDTDYARFVRFFPHFKQWVDIVNLDPGGLTST